MRALSRFSSPAALARVAGGRFSVLLAGVAGCAVVPALVGDLLSGSNGKFAADLAAMAAFAAAAGMLGHRIDRHVRGASELAQRFAQGETHLRLPDQRPKELDDLFAVLNSVADLIGDRELQFSLLSEATGDLVWDWNLVSDVVTCRGGATAAIGLDTDTFEFPNSWWMDRVHPLQRDALFQSFQDSFRDDQRLWSQEYLFRHCDGDYRYFWDRGVILRGADGTPKRVIGCMTDISKQKTAEEMIKSSERRYRSLVSATSSIVLSIPTGAAAPSRNPAWEEFTGRVDDHAVGWGWLEAFHPDDRERVAGDWKRALRTGQSYEAHARLQRRDGQYRWSTVRAVPVLDQAGIPVEWVGVVVDVHDEHEARLQLIQKTTDLGERVKELKCLHQVAVACNRDHVAILDVLRATAEALPPALLYPEAAGCEIEWSGHVIRALGRELVAGEASEPILEGGRQVGTVRIGYMSAEAGAALLSEEREMLGTVAALLGQMLSKRANLERIWHTANHDSLTGLPNRLRLQEELERLVRAGAEATAVALLLIDLDHFKDVNDTLGHDAGDALLAALGQRLKAAAESKGLVARLGGDEFAVILPGYDPAPAAKFGRDLLLELRQPVRFAGRDISTRATIGLAVSPADGATSAELLKNADIALYFGKSSGRNALAVYRSDMRDVIEKRIAVCAEVRESLDDDVFVPYYQPKVSLHTNHVKGFEALLRWKHPSRGLQSAGAALAAFEDHELALALGDRIRRHVLTDIRRWRDTGVEFHRVAINLSSAEFGRGDLAACILEDIQAAGLSPRDIGVEVTETVLLGREADVVGPVLGKLHDAGVQIALDDFGTGYASLTHLQLYPVDVIKVDQSFIRSVLTDAGSQAITSAVLELGRKMKMTVVAEGVETAAQAEFLRVAGCDEAQGFFFAKAMPSTRVPYILGGSEQNHWASSGLRAASSAA